MKKETIFKIVNIFIGVVMIFGGITNLINNILLPAKFIIALYLTGFGILLIAAELKFDTILKNF